MIALLDTSILIAQGSSAESTSDLSGYDDLQVSSISWSELTMGLHAAHTLSVYKEREARLTDLRKVFGAGIPYDDQCASHYGTILARITAQNGDPKAHRFDRMIAATALAHDLVVVTRNIAHFGMLNGLVPVEQR